MGVRGSRPKLIFYLSAAGEVITNGDETEVKIFLKLKRPRCRSCGAAVGPENVGYLGVYGRRTVAYCSTCVEDMLRRIMWAVALLRRDQLDLMIHGPSLLRGDE